MIVLGEYVVLLEVIYLITTTEQCHVFSNALYNLFRILSTVVYSANPVANLPLSLLVLLPTIALHLILFLTHATLVLVDLVLLTLIVCPVDLILSLLVAVLRYVRTTKY